MDRSGGIAFSHIGIGLPPVAYPGNDAGRPDLQALGLSDQVGIDIYLPLPFGLDSLCDAIGRRGFVIKQRDLIVINEL